MKSIFVEKYDTGNASETMIAVVTTGNGGYDKLQYVEIPIPVITSGEVLINVLAAGVNNTEINTRLGWYSESVSQSTDALSDTQQQEAKQKSDGGWNEVTPFPFIQGTDCCGRVVRTFNKEHEYLLNKRVIVRSCIRKYGFSSLENIWMGSDFDGAFAQYVKVPASEVFVVDCDWSDAELATIPCAYGTAENMVERAQITEHSCVLVTGASGGVGSAVVQLSKRRGARVIAVVGAAKVEQVKALGADKVVTRGDNILHRLGDEKVDVAIDNVAGEGFADVLKSINRGGRYVSSGAIAGPVVSLDMRNFYLKDITLIGCTAWDEPVFPNLVSYIENKEIRPLLAKVFPLERIAEAQSEFLKKTHVGNYVLIPPEVMLNV
ncbi:MAG: alcohol dehydrogenase family protein [Gammaproteobacteria bacterium]|nr:alcohol dehydrogenase family protein [Gammaproteobacteria bacterium]